MTETENLELTNSTPTRSPSHSKQYRPGCTGYLSRDDLLSELDPIHHVCSHLSARTAASGLRPWFQENTRDKSKSQACSLRAHSKTRILIVTLASTATFSHPRITPLDTRSSEASLTPIDPPLPGKQYHHPKGAGTSHLLRNSWRNETERFHGPAKCRRKTHARTWRLGGRRQ